MPSAKRSRPKAAWCVVHKYSGMPVAVEETKRRAEQVKAGWFYASNYHVVRYVPARERRRAKRKAQ
jgi:hypothetical protein